MSNIKSENHPEVDVRFETPELDARSETMDAEPQTSEPEDPEAQNPEPEGPEPVLPIEAHKRIAHYHIQCPNPTGEFDIESYFIEMTQAYHRIKLINAFGPLAIHPGARILEIGCGQGTCTAVLADAVSPSGGHITAIDPAPGTYGAPFTLAQAQNHLTSSPTSPQHIKNGITFHLQTDLFSLLQKNPNAKWDTAVLVHSIWYLDEPEKTLSQILKALKGKVKRICVAEYALQASNPKAVPHVLAAVTRGMLEAHKEIGTSESNIRGVISPRGIINHFEHAGGGKWRLERQAVVVPIDALSDGSWETDSVLEIGFLKSVEDEVRDERVKTVLRSSRDAVERAVVKLGGGNERVKQRVQTMDVWVGVFVWDESLPEVEEGGSVHVTECKKCKGCKEVRK
ncbi:hypothetical protein QBC38DRAFT_490176 [Podospora fimiseda]|uniref:Methyltransferase domain-containing protein n=1 Tax=Podospora fimiseda TaxID=252190 RepID=A0AAN7BFK4_9PEZI|nr:hypothetical protein QBC38DRAFT_490176 [Podospora fimiseda]